MYLEQARSISCPLTPWFFTSPRHHTHHVILAYLCSLREKLTTTAPLQLPECSIWIINIQPVFLKTSHHFNLLISEVSDASKTVLSDALSWHNTKGLSQGRFKRCCLRPYQRLFNIISIWGRYENMSPCTGSRVNSNYELTNGFTSRSPVSNAGLKISKTPSAAHYYVQRLDHLAMTHPSKTDWYQLDNFEMCSLRSYRQFHQPRLVIRTFHHQGRCSRGGHLCNEHSEEKYSCSYK